MSRKRKISKRLIAVFLAYYVFVRDHPNPNKDNWDKKKFNISYQAALNYFHYFRNLVDGLNLDLTDKLDQLKLDDPYSKYDAMGEEIFEHFKKTVEEKGDSDIATCISRDRSIVNKIRAQVKERNKKKDSEEKKEEQKEEQKEEEGDNSMSETSTVAHDVSIDSVTTEVEDVKKYNISNSPEILVRNVKKAREIGRKYRKEREISKEKESAQSVQGEDIPTKPPEATNAPKKFEIKLNYTTMIFVGVGVLIGVIVYFIFKKKSNNPQLVSSVPIIQPNPKPLAEEPKPTAEYSVYDRELLKAIASAERWSG